MDKDGAKELLLKLSVYYPRVYSSNMPKDRALGLMEDFMKSFVKYDNESVLQALYDFHLESEKAPTVYDLLNVLRNGSKFKRISDKEWDAPTTWYGYFEDNEGFGYAKNSKTNDYDCIWKINWAEKGLSKMKVLKEHGIASY